MIELFGVEKGWEGNYLVMLNCWENAWELSRYQYKYDLEIHVIGYL